MPVIFMSLLFRVQSHLGRRGPSPATACGSHYHHRLASAGGAPAPRRPAARTTIIGSPRPAGPQPRDGLRLALPLRLRVVELLRRFPAFESLHQLALVGRQPPRRQEVRTFAPREPDRPHTAPARGARVVAP